MTSHRCFPSLAVAHGGFSREAAADSPALASLRARDDLMKAALESGCAQQFPSSEGEGPKQRSFRNHQAHSQLSARRTNPRVPFIRLVSMSSPKLHLSVPDNGGAA